MYLYENGRRGRSPGRSMDTPSVPCLRTYHMESFKRRKRSVSATHVRTYKMIEGGIEHSGYIDIKQPPKIKGRKLKSWKKKWVSIREMTIRSVGRPAAKVDIYTDEKTALNSPADKQTFILEFVTDVRAAKSKTHIHAFEIVERETILLLSGATELETQTWISTFRKIFFPDEDQNDVFPVQVISNKHASLLSLTGAYSMSVNPAVITITSKQHNSYEWSLNMLKRFHLERDVDNPGMEILTIECGPRSECGEATFRFRSDYVTNILASIKANICLALSRKKAERTNQSNSTTEKPSRTSVAGSISSSSIEHRIRSETCGSTEQRYKDLLENTANDSQKGITSRASSETFASEVGASDDIDIPRKKRQSVSFDTTVVNESVSPKDMLTSPIEIVDEHNGSAYNKVEFHLPNSSPAVGNIITTFTVAKPGYETRVLLDEHGYSHVDIKTSKFMFSDDKTRSFSNMSSHSSVSCRSASVGSRDSGILYSVTDKKASLQRGTTTNRSTNSFDSAVSTSSTVEGTETSPVDSNATTLTVEIQEVEVTAAEFMLGNSDNGIYQDVTLEDNTCDNKVSDESQNARQKPKLRKCNSTGDFRKEEKENEYEDLDNFRKGKKNLVKHLGMDPKIDPKSVPPSLPERPLSHKIKRKIHNNEKKLFTLPFARNKGKKKKDRAISMSSSSSDSDSESSKGSKKIGDMTIKAWPLGNKSVFVGNEDLYQPIAIERFLKDNDGMTVPQKRERSSSLNLNMESAMKRPSVSSSRRSETVDRNKSLWKHNRNVSMQLDMLNRRNDPNSSTLNVDIKHNFDLSLQPGMIGDDNKRSSIDMNSNHERTIESADMPSDGEPIYAEVGPTTKSFGAVENPFPNLTIWTPADISDVPEVSELDGTKYENDESMDSLKNMESGDMLNEGFVIDNEVSDSHTCDNENILIDLSVSESGDIANTTRTAVDIFNMGIRSSVLETSHLYPMSKHNTKPNSSVNFIDIFKLGCGTPLPPSSSNLLNTSKSVIPSSNSSNSNLYSLNETSVVNFSESIYMDMTTCKNESIYVLPSTLKR